MGFIQGFLQASEDESNGEANEIEGEEGEERPMKVERGKVTPVGGGSDLEGVGYEKRFGAGGLTGAG